MHILIVKRWYISIVQTSYFIFQKRVNKSSLHIFKKIFKSSNNFGFISPTHYKDTIFASVNHKVVIKHFSIAVLRLSVI